MCPTCSRPFELNGHEKTYCSSACKPRAGSSNPNYGKRHPGMFQHSPEVRALLSDAHLGAGNPNWKGGGSDPGARRMQTYARKWALRHIGHSCQQCSATEDLEVHHVVARRYFQDHRLSHFPQNLMVLCRKCHRSVDGNQRKDKAQLHEIPFVDRVPQSILDLIARDGSVSSLPSDVRLIDLSTTT